MPTTITRTSLLAMMAVAVAIAVIFAAGAQLALADQDQAPTGLTLTATDANTVQATWTAHPDGARDYRLSWAPHDENFKTWTDTDWNAFPTGNSYTITGLEGGSTYKVKVRARFETGPPSDWSGIVTATTTAPPEPTPAPTPQPTPEPTPDATPEPAIDYDQERNASVSLGDITNAAVDNRDETVDTDDPVDYFHFSLTHQRTVGLRIRRLDYNADLYVEDNDGTVIASSENGGDQKEVLNLTLAATGANEYYYVRVEAKEDGRNDYQLRYFTDAPPNAAATGAPTISGAAQVRETLSAGVSGIADDNGLSNASFDYQWVRSVDGTDTDITSATGSTFLLTYDEHNHTIRVRVSFTDDAGYPETLTSDATATVVRPPNASPSGRPAVSGVLAVGKTLTVDTSGITDPNGLSNPAFTYQWVRSIDSTDTDIAGATGSTYPLASSDEGAAFKVTVAFTDDDGYAETLTSGLTQTVMTEPEPEPGGRADRSVLRNAVTLISNTGQTTASAGYVIGLSGTTNWSSAIGFTAGGATNGYTIAELSVNLSTFRTGAVPKVSIYTSASGLPGTLEFTFTNPGSYVNGLNTFTAPANATLAGSADYFVVLENTGTDTYNMRTTESTADDAGAATGWSLGDVRYGKGQGTWAPQGGSNIAQVAIKGSAIGATASDDATLSALTLKGTVGSEVIDLDPTFDGDTHTYTAAAVNRIAAVTLTATKTSSNATVAITDDDDTTPGEADFDLDVGANTLELVVTAEDGVTTKTYTITVTRAAPPPAPTDCPSDYTWCATMRVGYSPTEISPFLVEGFGYSAGKNFGDLSSTTFTHGVFNYEISLISVLRNTNTDSDTVTSEELIFYIDPELPDDTVLQVGSRTFTVNADSRLLSNPKENNWDILNDHPPTLTWTAGQHVTVSLEISPPSTDATLSALALTDDADAAITLIPEFASGTTEYRAWVANDVTPVTLTATKNDSDAAAAAITDDDDTTTPGEADFALEEGANTLEVVVTAEDEVATETYTVTVVREAAAPTANPDAVWTANLTVGVVEISGITLSGYTPATLNRTGFGAVAPLSFDVDSKAMKVVGLSYDSTSLSFTVTATDADATLSGRDWVLLLGTQTFDIPDPGTSTEFAFSDHGLSWAHGDVVPVELSEAPPEVTIAADATSAVYREDASAFTLTRTGATTDTLAVTVELTQTGGRFISHANRSKTVTFAVGSATAALSVDHQEHPLGEAISSGTLTATVVDGTDYDVGTADTAEMDIIVALMVGFDMDSYTVDEEAGTLQVTLVGRTGVGAPVPTAVYLSVTSKGGIEYDEEFPASSPEDYGPISVVAALLSAEFVPDGDVFKAEYTIDIPIIDDDIDENDETFFFILEKTPGLAAKWKNFVDASGGVICDVRDCQTPIIIIDTDPVSADIDSLAFTNMPASGNYYETGETVTVGVTYDEAVVVDTTSGTPTLDLTIGGVTRSAAYTGVSSDDLVLTFSYEIDGTDRDRDGIAIPAGSLALNGGTIILDGTTDAAHLVHDGKDASGSHRVNKAPEVVSGGVIVTSTPVAGTDTYGAGETIRFTVTFDAPVTVDTTGGTPRLRFRLADGGNNNNLSPNRDLDYVSGTDTDTLTFEYEVVSGDSDTTGVFVKANALQRNSGTIKHHTTGRDAVLDHARPGASGNFPGAKVDGSLTPPVAMLTGLTLSEVTLNETFAATTRSYTADVASSVAVTTVTATAETGATAVVSPADSNGRTAGHQVALDVGETAITVEVTKPGAVTRTYTVLVTREAPTLVSNIGQDRFLVDVIVGTSGPAQHSRTQSFKTGNNATGYTLSEVRVRFGVRDAGAEPKMTIYTAAANGTPVSSLYEMIPPTTVRANGVNTFTAPAGATLAPSTSGQERWYSMVFEDTSSDESYRLKYTTSDDEDSGGEQGWEIGDNHRSRTSDGGSWTTNAPSLSISIRGIVNPGSYDETLADSFVTVSEPDGQDFPDSEATRGRVVVGANGATGFLSTTDTEGAGDAFKISLAAGRRYRVEVLVDAYRDVGYGGNFRGARCLVFSMTSPGSAILSASTDMAIRRYPPITIVPPT